MYVVCLLSYEARTERERVHVLLVAAVTLGGIRHFAAYVIPVLACAEKLARKDAFLFSEGYWLAIFLTLVALGRKNTYYPSLVVNIFLAIGVAASHLPQSKFAVFFAARTLAFVTPVLPQKSFSFVVGASVLIYLNSILPHSKPSVHTARKLCTHEIAGHFHCI